MDKWGMAEKVVLIVLIWLMLIALLYGMAINSDYEGDRSVLFGNYVVETIKGVYYLTIPIVLFLIACALLKKE